MKALDQRARSVDGDIREVKVKGARLIQIFRGAGKRLNSCLDRVAVIYALANKVRSNERILKNILDNSTVLTVNSGILASKKELTPMDVATLSDNFGQLIRQFERSIHIFTESTGEVEKMVTELADALRSEVRNVNSMFTADQDVVQAVEAAEKVLHVSSSELTSMAREFSYIEKSIDAMAKDLNEIEVRSIKLSQIGQASLELQAQIEKGFSSVSTAMSENIKTA
jgi:uncharacterized membrane protein YgaE (UPF0421/DUF939 family)